MVLFDSIANSIANSIKFDGQPKKPINLMALTLSTSHGETNQNKPKPFSFIPKLIVKRNLKTPKQDESIPAPILTKLLTRKPLSPVSTQVPVVTKTSPALTKSSSPASTKSPSPALTKSSSPALTKSSSPASTNVSPASTKSSSPPAPLSALASYYIGDYRIGKTIGYGTFGRVKSKQVLILPKFFFS